MASRGRGAAPGAPDARAPPVCVRALACEGGTGGRADKGGCRGRGSVAGLAAERWVCGGSLTLDRSEVGWLNVRIALGRPAPCAALVRRFQSRCDRLGTLLMRDVMRARLRFQSACASAAAHADGAAGVLDGHD